jgi:protein-tyrosine phosphatase
MVLCTHFALLNLLLAPNNNQYVSSNANTARMLGAGDVPHAQPRYEVKRLRVFVQIFAPVRRSSFVCVVSSCRAVMHLRSIDIILIDEAIAIMIIVKKLLLCWTVARIGRVFSWSSSSSRQFPLNSDLMERAKRLRQAIERSSTIEGRIMSPFALPPSADSLHYPSTYAIPSDQNGRCLLTNKKVETEPELPTRGFCNWLIPGHLMVGQYPGVTPEAWGPSATDVKEHVRTIVQDAKINLFCCLQSEVPPQTDGAAWGSQGQDGEGEVYLPMYLRDEFPRPFTHYAPLVVEAFRTLKEGESVSHLALSPAFWYEPIEDLSTPDSQALQELLLKLLTAMTGDEQRRVVYLHCWGGRGRAGVVGACLISLLYPELDGDQVLQWAQCGYDTRAGASLMSPQLQQSPQTSEQRDFVRQFVVVNHQRQARTKK